MDKAKQKFSAQYLAQVHEEWLYVQAAMKGGKSETDAGDPESGETHYSFHIEIHPRMSQVRRS